MTYLRLHRLRAGYWFWINTDIGPVLAHWLTLGQHWYTNVGPTWICPLGQCWHNGGIQSLAQRWPNVSMQSCANVGSTLAQLTNPCWPNVGVPTLAQHKSWRWAIVAMLAGLPGSQFNTPEDRSNHYSDVIMSAMASQITSLTIVYSTLYLGTDQRKHQSSASLAFVRGIHESLVNSPHKGPVTQKMFPFDDIITVTQEDPLTSPETRQI